ncbi:VWA domain-containing protein [Azoarcus sp. KH32C]|uniref:VWA domain-containing protein n=1 Tax=Azoarcus sp. KH32C TaxID=748247 RepID=UPI0002386AED|nr:VWA domain-containing protein [Azoarcus sp. KH32C]BAL22713.1 hypothetical protein AZKH_0367 [Azoarcus sp. KH32C]
MSFLWPWLLALLPLPWLVRRCLPATDPGAVLRVPSLDAFVLPSPNQAALPGPARTRRRVGIDLWLASTAWMLLVLAAARPLAPADPHDLPATGRDLMLALDISASMATADLGVDGRPTERLTVARRLAQDFLSRRDGDRVGLIVFGKQAYLHTPLTFDLDAVRAALDDVAIGLAGRETALGDAIALAATRLREFGGNARVLVLLTDGANTAGQLTPTQAGWIAQREGLRIHVVGIGAERTQVAMADGPRETNPSADLDEDSLRELAGRTGGSYRRATDAAGLSAFYRLIDDLEPTDLGHADGRPAQELYPWPLAAALVLATLIALRRRTGARR